MHPNEAVKRLAALEKENVIVCRLRDGSLFHTAAVGSEKTGNLPETP